MKRSTVTTRLHNIVERSTSALLSSIYVGHVSSFFCRVSIGGVSSFFCRVSIGGVTRSSQARMGANTCAADCLTGVKMQKTFMSSLTVTTHKSQ